MRIGHGGDTMLHHITGMHLETIRRGREELENDLRDRPILQLIPLTRSLIITEKYRVAVGPKVHP